MSEVVAPEYERFIAAEQRAKRLPVIASHAMREGATSPAVFIKNEQASELMRVAARRAAGFFHPTQRTEIVWVDGDSELAINIATLNVKLADGLVGVIIPVRCDQVGSAEIEVIFAVGTAASPSGLYASSLRRPRGPPVIVEAWGEALVAFGWQCVVGLISGIAGATGKDARGNVLVPVEMSAARGGIQIVPMARHRFAGSSGLKPTTTRGTRA
jgi:hypothetical protein